MKKYYGYWSFEAGTLRRVKNNMIFSDKLCLMCRCIKVPPQGGHIL